MEEQQLEWPRSLMRATTGSSSAIADVQPSPDDRRETIHQPTFKLLYAAGNRHVPLDSSKFPQ